MRLAQTEDACLRNLDGAVINCEGPNEHLYKFEGNIELEDGAVLPIGPDQILLRGSCLRNTQWIIGVCIYTGHETKIMKNGTNARAKVSKVTTAMNRYILLTMLFQLVVSICASVATSSWTYFKGADNWYIYPN